MAGITEVLERLVNEPGFRYAVLTDPVKALGGYEFRREDAELLANAAFASAAGGQPPVETRVNKESLIIVVCNLATGAFEDDGVPYARPEPSSESVVGDWSSDGIIVDPDAGAPAEWDDLGVPYARPTVGSGNVAMDNDGDFVLGSPEYVREGDGILVGSDVPAADSGADSFVAVHVGLARDAAGNIGGDSLLDYELNDSGLLGSQEYFRAELNDAGIVQVNTGSGSDTYTGLERGSTEDGYTGLERGSTEDAYTGLERGSTEYTGLERGLTDLGPSNTITIDGQGGSDAAVPQPQGEQLLPAVQKVAGREAAPPEQDFVVRDADPGGARPPADEVIRDTDFSRPPRQP